MRDAYKQDLDHLRDNLDRMIRYVSRATKRARSAMKETDLMLAEQTIDADDRIDDLADMVESTTLSMLALQAPVASDLRLITGAMKFSQALERMGDLATHVAQVARSSYPEPPTPEPIQSVLNEMADKVCDSVELLEKLLNEQDMSLVAAIIDGDDEIDEYNQRVRRLVADPEVEMTRQQIVNATLLARFLERLGDHAAKAAGRMLYIVRGDLITHHNEDIEI
ncbi:phosphate signaling complex protein PhoU [Boudabousia marimammalium]|uniref:Phosphate-specific transport system accessory protein PhoU n=1 Tax=Boudabousia marimammalium TaxID=156892 RepID=A0A1Q5PM74_9ACTO|nr:phosphate signaling complex protein PhoU [Boudabousia marimammalium]OKL48636.1 phosphate transport system regulatory protein PhoU [Boudabousia marimammalium]